MKLTKNAKIAILLPEKPTIREQFAAEELEKYLKKILNVIIDQNDPAVRFVIGGPNRNVIAKELISGENFAQLLTGEC